MEQPLFDNNTLKLMKRAAKKLTREDKRCMIVSLYVAGMDPRSIHEAIDYSVAFIHDTLRQFAHDCTVRAVKETANGQVTEG